jgi:hypothetical protein
MFWRLFIDAPPVMKLSMVFSVCGVIGMPVLVLGASNGDRATLTVGLVLVGLFAVDLLFVWPAWRARRDLQRRRRL